MEEQKSNAGQGLGIAGLILGLLAIPAGLFPCTFYIGIIFGIIGIVLSVVALSQANRGYGPKTLIIAALVCSVLGLSFASIWGFTLSKGGARVVKEMMREGGFDRDEDFRDWDEESRDILRDMESDSAGWSDESSDEMQEIIDSLKSLEEE
ncbi:MAG TPA: hypothetical protein VJ203_14670 [Bacteroidales bacterium]|nr:hypothetical protein [Bacteroidales bacterium]